MSEQEGVADNATEEETSIEDTLYPESGDENGESQETEQVQTQSDEDSQEQEGEGDAYKDLSFPEGAEVDEERLANVKERFSELGYTSEQAQEAVNIYSEMSQEIYDQFEQTKTEWENESKSDSEYGGENFNANIGVAGKAIDTFGNEGFIKMLNETGVGNHPEMMRFVWKVGQTLQEDSPNSGIAGGQGQELSREEILYPNS